MPCSYACTNTLLQCLCLYQYPAPVPACTNTLCQCLCLYQYPAPVSMPVPIPCSSASACTNTMRQHSNSPLSWSVVTAAVKPTPEEPRPVVAMARGAVFSTYLTHCHNENTSDPLPCVAHKHQTRCRNETYQTHCHV